MNRRTFLKLAAAVPAASALSRLPGVVAVARAQQKEFNPRPGAWRAWEVTTRVEIARPAGVTRVWVPVPVVEGEYQKVQESRWSGNGRVMEQVEDPRYGAAMVYAEFPESEKTPLLEVVSRFQTRDRSVDWSQKTPARLDAAETKKWTQPTDLMPTDGIVKETAQEIVKGKTSDLDKTRAIYDWILVNTYREPKVRGCGVGDIKGMLMTRNLGGKCADLNGLFVGLVRAAGVPARDVYGIRVGPSAFGYRSLGAGSATITKSQHCRAEVFLAGYGWVAMDPADVAKAAREETGEWLKIDHALIAPVRRSLFGGWEGNWLAYNVAHDVQLPRSTHGGKLGFLMYPQAETAEGRRDCLDPDTFKYTITTTPVTG
ncbi:MAG TPA: transglutaminase domain-containing protein [Thermoanaerobaculia bacterium]|jgi:transglutaminase-like putative cysteine protease